MPGVLKNAVDVGSRPFGTNAWAGKPAAVISAALGATGGFGANHHLRQSLVCLDVPTMPAPEAYLGRADTLFDETGALASPSTRKFLTEFMQRFEDWGARHATRG